MNWSDDEIKGKVLHKLARFGKFEHSHTSIEHLQKGFPKDLAGRVKELIYELKKEGILKSKPTNYGEQVSINVEKQEQVMRYIDIFLKKTD
ncbi:MAG TPA: hypothetical protein VJJ82_04095 [Candidatus Nanoarchaeia archaeon]|nr:hypothetical protein [Candidatus Nanoarchaeia archaeon]